MGKKSNQQANTLQCKNRFKATRKSQPFNMKNKRGTHISEQNCIEH